MATLPRYLGRLITTRGTPDGVFAGAERGSCIFDIVLRVESGSVRPESAAARAIRSASYERRHGLGAVVAGVLENCTRVMRTQSAL